MNGCGLLLHLEPAHWANYCTWSLRTGLVTALVAISPAVLHKPIVQQVLWKIQHGVEVEDRGGIRVHFLHTTECSQDAVFFAASNVGYIFDVILPGIWPLILLHWKEEERWESDETTYRLGP